MAMLWKKNNIANKYKGKLEKKKEKKHSQLRFVPIKLVEDYLGY